jgi:hypothetical protein
MSTRINVTVGDAGLLDRNAQQTAANRQAKLLADQRAAAETLGVERRAADRTAAGLDPLTGLPAFSPSSASTVNRLDQEPAANRFGSGLGSFYLTAKIVVEGADTFADYIFTSGNGEQTAEVRIKIQTSYTDQKPDNVLTQTLVAVGDPCAFLSPGYYEATEVQIQYEVVNGVSQFLMRELMLPLDNNTCVYVFAYKRAALPTLLTRRRTFVRRYQGFSTGTICAVGALLEEFTIGDTYTASVLEDKIETQYVCVLAGQNECRLVPTSQQLQQAIEQSVQFDYVKESNTAGPNLDLTVTYESYALSLPENYFPLQGLLYSGLGISSEGRIRFSVATPLAWFALDSFDNSKAIEQAQTYEDLLSTSINIGSTTIATLLSPANQLGELPDGFSFLRRSDGQYLAGSLFEQNYPYTGSGWASSPTKRARTEFPPRPDGYTAVQRVTVYAWGKRGFCSEQAARYKIL